MKVYFTSDQAFGLQKDEVRGTERTVRRVIKSIQDLKMMVEKMTAATTVFDLSELLDKLPHDDSFVPHHFFCPITQDVMQDPVKTIDGMVYDRPAIERWFTISSKSPLTGVFLAKTTLIPHTDLRDQIVTFFKNKMHSSDE